MRQSEPWGGTAVPMEADCKRRGQLPRMHESGELKCIYRYSDKYNFKLLCFALEQSFILDCCYDCRLDWSMACAQRAWQSVFVRIGACHSRHFALCWHVFRLFYRSSSTHWSQTGSELVYVNMQITFVNLILIYTRDLVYLRHSF